MLGDYMISTDYPEMSISEITLAYFEDTGYYKVNYYTGGLFRYGKNRGCSFFEKDCVYNEGKDTLFPNEFCTEAESFFCGSSHLSRGECYIVEHDEIIDSKFRYYSNSKKGGFSSADYCPVSYNYYSELDSEYRYPYNCNYGANLYSELGEIIGSNSLCFESSLLPNIYNEALDFKVSICYKMKCDKKNKQIILNILDKTVTCPGYETVLNDPDGFKGQIKCPDYNIICTSDNWCNELFDCINKNDKFDSEDDYKIYGLNYSIIILAILVIILF
jgi:hypothetical protein